MWISRRGFLKKGVFLYLLIGGATLLVMALLSVLPRRGREEMGAT